MPAVVVRGFWREDQCLAFHAVDGPIHNRALRSDCLGRRREDNQRKNCFNFSLHISYLHDVNKIRSSPSERLSFTTPQLHPGTSERPGPKWQCRPTASRSAHARPDLCSRTSDRFCFSTFARFLFGPWLGQACGWDQGCNHLRPESETSAPSHF